jgi:hypothetical protein
MDGSSCMPSSPAKPNPPPPKKNLPPSSWQISSKFWSLHNSY